MVSVAWSRLALGQELLGAAADCDAAWPDCHQTVDGSYHQCQLIGLLAATFYQAASRHLPSLQRQPRCPHLILTEPLYRFRPPVATAT